MRYWYGYTGRNLIVGHGRTVRRIVTDASVQQLLDMAGERRVSVIPPQTYIAAMVVPLAVQKFGVTAPPATAFSSAGQLLRLFDGLPIDQVAVNVFNGRTASAYAEAGDIAARVARGFESGALLTLPRDAARLPTPEILNALPGAVAFLLSRAHAERKAFANYLRRGAPPMVSATARRAIATSRPVLRTWEREARLLNEGARL